MLAQLDGSAALSASARHHARTRLFGLQQACYQLGSLTVLPSSELSSTSRLVNGGRSRHAKLCVLSKVR